MRRIIDLGTLFVHTYLVELRAGWLLVDTGYPFDYKHFLRAARKHDIALSDIRYVVLTHVHADHAGFLKEILSDSGAQLICLPAERDRLLSGVNEKDVYISRRGLFLFNRISAALSHFQTFEPIDITGSLDPETQPLLEEGITFFVLHGHTDNDLCFRVEDRVFVGDICMNGPLAAGYSPILIEDNVALVRSWRELVTMEGETLYVGHGRPFPKRELIKYIDRQAARRLRKLFG